jgi:hypothetical protein
MDVHALTHKCVLFLYVLRRITLKLRYYRVSYPSEIKADDNIGHQYWG